jgi:deoxyadenosine/deoxycytidine kinase
MYIAIAGNIGSGKTTLASLLAKHFGWQILYDRVEENPYLHDFYVDMQRWSFNLQMFFLKKRVQQILDIRQSSKNVIQDRTLYEDVHIFAPNLHAMDLLSDRDLDTYISLFNLMEPVISPPDLIIYLKASVHTLVKQIESRDRGFEQSINIDYLKRLNERYNAWASSYNKGKILTIEVDEVPFHQDEEALGKVVERVNAQLFGLFDQ